ncbi:MAG: flagellar assembly protein T N-terminal domain-containing protein, partial [Pontibacterium sp.]
MLSIHPTLLVLIAFCLSLFSLGAKAVSVEAIGYAAIFNNDLVNARKQAIADASAQASMQAAAHLSTNQQVKDGILEIDEMQIT